MRRVPCAAVALVLGLLAAMRRPGGLFLAGALLLVAAPSRADDTAPEPHEDTEFDVMHLLKKHGLHDLQNERWNAYGQLTWISSFKAPFHAPYTNANGSTNSLSPDYEHSYTASATLFLGVRLWQGAEAYFVPEVIAERPLSLLRGLGAAIQNGELQKNGSNTPQIYRSQTYLRQTIGLGGERVRRPSDPLQLGTTVDSRRLVLVAGNFTVLDFFDRNSFAGDVRQQFLNLSFLTYGAYDFASDARGYSWGAATELYYDDWTLRLARMAPPENPNDLPTDFRIWEFYGDQAELEHRHELFGQPGAVRLLAYRNRENMGRFDEAIAANKADPGKNATTCPGYNYGSENAGAPDVCWVRRPNIKVGVGLNVEQHITDDVGVFFRGMISDGRSEVYAYTPADRSLSFGVTARGAAWRRPMDVTGVGASLGWISDVHAEYLRLGGVDGFIGDGDIHPDCESVFEVFYSVNLLRALWLTADYQHITNPAFNADRGPVDVFGVRAHAEF